MASAYGATVTYSKGGQGIYTTCITSSGSGTGASILGQIEIDGLPHQPKNIAGPDSNWSGTAMQNGSTWSVIWSTDVTMGSGIAADNTAHCGFTFQSHGKPLSGSYPVQLWYFTASGYAYAANPVTTTAS
jgi:hypothetical protein